ncbi:MAG: FG-GAP-like repeat-containing protein, partial [Taibaiella sp.]|nr:FG-GAP-like repeat-containing protein [Taibaiella sp.]
MKLRFLNYAKTAASATICTLLLMLAGMLAATSASAQTVLYAEGTDMANTGDGTTYDITTPGTYRWTGTLSTPSDQQDRFSINLGSGVQISSASYTISGGAGFNGSYGFYVNSASISGNGSAAMSSGIGFPMPPISPGPFYNNIYIGASFSVGNTWIVDMVVTAYCTPPTVAIAMSPSGTLCTGSSKTLTASGATTYTWAPATGLSATTGATVTASPASTTTYTVIGTTGSCTNTATRTVTVATSPTVTTSISPTGAMCAGETKTITASGATTYIWSPATGLSATTGASVTCSSTITRTYTVTGTAANGCIDQATRIINVNAVPTATIAMTPTGALCPGSSKTLTAGGATTYTWAPATGLSATTGASVTASPTATTTYTVTGTTSGCSDDATRTITVTNPPVITSVSSLVGIPGNTRTITGTGFNGINANNIVFFGATRANVTGSTTTSLTATVPVGATYKEISLNNQNCGLTGYAQYPFLPTYNNSAFASGKVNFAVKQDFTAGSNPTKVVIGDIDGDGKADLVVANHSDNTVSVYRNTSSSGSITSGSFAAQVTFATGIAPNSVAIGDLDGDGKPDLVVSNFTSSTVSVLRNTSSSGSITSGSFATQVTFATGTSPNSVAIGDIDGDGKPDLAVANYYSNNVSVLRNTSSSGSITSGSFDSQVTFATGTLATSVAIGDIDGDGKPDLAVANASSNNVSVLRNTSTSGSITSGSFATQVTFATGNGPYNVTIGDIDGDGKPDLAVANQTSNNVSILRNTSSSGSITSGSFDSQVTFATGAQPVSIAISDIDGDTKPDLAVANYVSSNVSVLRNTSSSGSITSGSFAAQVTFATGNLPFSVAIGDLDGDAKPDLVTGNFGSNNVSVLRNNPLSLITGTLSACPGSATTLSNATTGGTWSSSNTAIATVGSTTGVVTGVAAGTVTITYAGTAGASFALNRVTATVTVNALPTVATSVSVTGPICMGSSKTITASGATTYTWAPATGLSATTGVTVTASPTVTTTYTVTGTTLGCTDQATRNINVNPLPTIDAGAGVAICRGSSTAITATGGVTYTWAPNTALSATTGASVTASPTTTVTYTVTGTDANGCVNTATKVVTVNVVPTVTTTMTPTGNLCLGSSKTLTAGGATTYTWAPATGLSATTGASVTASPLVTTTYTITGTNAAGCSDDATRTITITNPPDITSVSTLMGIPGTAVSLTGTGFNTTLANNIVYFGATRATVTAATTTSLTATIPVGATYKEISVNNQNCDLTGYAQYPFLPTYNNSAFAPATVNYSAKTDFAAGLAPYSVAIGDIDGDGKPDLAVANGFANTVSVYRNTSSSGSITSASFATQVTFVTGSYPYSVAIADIDGDGKPDLAVASYGSNGVSVHRNTSSSGSITSGSFATHVTFYTGNYPRSVAIGDIDGDGKPDLAVANDISNTVSVLRNTSSSGSITSGSFATRVTFTTELDPSSVAIGDIDGDGKPDLVVTNDGGTQKVSVLRNTSSSGSITTGSFATHVTFATGTRPLSVAIGDIDGDGKPDLAVANYSSSTVSVYRNTSSSGSITSGSFAAQVTFATGSQPYSVAIGDIDGDGKPDLAVANQTSNNVSVLRNTSSSGSITSGSFATQVPFATGTNPYSVAIGDIDGDGKPDLAVANYGSDNVSVLRNDPLSPITGTQSVCLGATTTLSNAATGGTWSSSNTAIATVASATGVVTGVAAGTATITYAGTAGASFAGNRVTTVVTVNALPTISAGAGVAICRGSSTTLTATGGTTYTWSPNTALSATTGASVTASPTTTVTYTVTGTNASGCSNTATKTVTVNPLPTISAGAGVAICRGSSSTLTATGGATYTWAPGTALSATTGASVTASPTTTVTYTVTGTNANGCVNTATKVVTVNVVPTVTTTMTPTGALCLGSSKTLTAGGATTYTWAPATGLSATTGASVTASPTVTTIYTVTGTTSGCSDDATRTITVTNPPDITSVSTLVGIPGTAVSLTGTGFNATIANNIVFFGATRATVTAATTTSLTATIPVGATYKEISLNNQNCQLTGYSQYPFLPTYDNSPFIPGTVNMNGKVDFTTGTNPLSVAIGDLDGDGKADLAVANYISNTVSVYRNISSSGAVTAASFAARVDFTTGTNPLSVAIGDLDGDGKPDLVVANYGSATVSVFRNTSSSGAITAGSFAARVDFTTGWDPRSVAIGDLDGDGKADLAVANASSTTVSVFRNTSSSGAITSGSFAARVDFATGSAPHSVAIGDLDGDGKADLAVANFNSGTVSVFRNTSSSGAITSGSFAARVDFTTGFNPFSVAIGDLDGDGKADLAVANFNSATVSVFRNTSTSGAITSGSFAARVDFTTGTGPLFVAIGDLDGDGKADLAVANNGSATVSVFRNTSSSGAITSGSFAARVDFTTGTQPRSVAIGDLDGDGKPDLAMANYGSDNVSVLRNNPISPITGTQSVCVGTTTTLSNAATGGTWSSSNTAIATVGSTTGVVTGVAAGTVTITYAGTAGASFAGNRVTAIVTVNAIPTIIADGGTNLCMGTSATLTASGGTSYTWAPATGLSATTGASVTATPYSAVTYTVTGTTSGCSNTATTSITITNPPAITSTSALLGIPGTSVTINGTGFNTTDANNIVYFGATQATVTGSSTTSLTATVPTGATYKSLSLNNQDCALTGYSQYPFLPTYNNSAFAPATVNFNPRTSFTSGTSPNSVAIGDIDGDGKPDLAVTNNVSHTVSVYRNTSSSGSITSGSFATQVTFATEIAPANVVMGDIDGDGKPDLAVTNFNSNIVSVLRNTSSSGSITSGSFAAQVPFATGSQPFGLAIGDIDGDGKPDLAVANRSSNTVSVYRNTGSIGSITSGSFATQVTFATGTSPNSVAIGDIDGDGKPDLAVANSASNSVSVLRNTSSIGSITSGSFAAQVTFAAGSGPYDVAISDIDGDGKPELVVPNSTSNSVAVYRNTSSSGSITSSSFAARVSFATGTSPASVTIGDIDGDGKPDMAVANYDANTVSVYRNTGSIGSITSGSFATQVTFATGTNPHSVAIGDIDGDGKPDVAVANRGSNTVAIYRNNPLSPITGTQSVCVGATTTLSNATTGGKWSSSNTAIATVGLSTGVVTGVAAGTVTITYAGTAGASFTGNRVTAIVTINTIPTVTAGSNVTICTGSSTTMTASGATTYTWSPATGLSATTGASVTASPATTVTYTVTGSNGCTNTATKTVSVNTTPTIAAGSGATICRGSSTTLSASGGTTYTWAPNTALSAATGASVTASPTTTVTYTVTGTTDGCSSTATQMVSVNPLPTISAGAGVAICRGSSTTLTATGGATYTWSPNTALSATTGASVTASPTTTVTYTVTGTNANGCVNTATKVVTVNAVPTITPGSAATICSGATAALSASGASTYTWSPAADLSASTGANVTASPTITTTYTVTGTNTLGCSNTATQLVTVNELPDAFTGSTTICAGSTSTLSSAPGGGVWTSSNNAIATVGTSSGIVSGIAAGTSSITYTLGTGCRRKVTVTVNAALTISAGTGVAICSGNSTSLTATGGLTYSWSPATALSATTGASVTASPTTTVTYTVTGTNANGCVNTATKTVTVNALPTISAGTQLNLCIGQSSAISATGGTTYTWSPGTGLSATTGASVTASPTTTVTYTVTGTNANGCTNFATKLVSVNPLPTVSAGANVAICRGSSTTLSATGTGSTYTWGPNIGLSAIAGASVTASPTVTITYTVTAMHSNGCTNLATKTVSVNALPTITAGAGVAICQGSSTAMTASGGVTYTWAPGTALTATTGASVTASPTTTVTYTVSGTNANGCVNTATKTVTVNASPTIVAGADATICRGASTALTASGGTTYTWAPNTALSATTGASVTASPTTTVT